MATIAVHAPELTGETGLSLYLWSLAGVLLNAGGDALTETPASSGRFVADVAETVTATMHARVHDAVGIVRDGWLPDGTTLIVDAYPATGGGGGTGDAEQATSEDILEIVTANGVKLDTIAAKTALITAGRIRVLSRVAGAVITAKAGDDHLVAASNALSLEIDDDDCAIYQFLRTATHTAIEFGAGQSTLKDEITADISSAEITHVGTQTFVPIELAGTKTVNLRAGEYAFDIQVTTASGHKVTKPELEGTLNLTTDRKS